jgi:NAD(P)-dependent dehydrogenase (short-subunit alcohol dehydrogenase family)
MLKNKVAIVTGSTSGIGLGIARELAKAGASLVLNGFGDASEIEAIRSGIERDHDVRVVYDGADMSKGDAVRGLIAATVEKFGRLDILVNNAGLGPSNEAENVTEADYDLTMDVNVKGLFFASQAAGRVMIRQGSGRIVNLSSQAGFVALPTESIYCASKAAVAHLTKCLAVEWGRHGITVNAVAPTFIRTDGTAEALADPAFEADVRERIAGLHRIGEPMDVAGGVVFLASPAAGLITGTTLLIDGGWTAR